MTKVQLDDLAELHYQRYRAERLTLWLNRLTGLLEPTEGGWHCRLCPNDKLTLERALVHLRAHRPSWFSSEMDRD